MRVGLIERVLVGAMGLGLFGCSDLGSDLVDLTETETGTGDPEFGSSSGPPPDTEQVDDTGDPAGSTGGDEFGDTEGACGEIDCGPGGYCDLDEQGAPLCACDPGYAPYGLRCLQCEQTEGEVTVDIPVVSVSAQFLLNGEPFPPTDYEDGEIILRDPTTADEIILGNTHDGGTDDTVAVVPGTYELYYRRESGGDLVPRNSGARLGTTVIPDTGSHDLMVDVPAKRLTGEFTLAGAPPPDSQYENGVVVLRDRATGDEVELGQTRHGDYSMMVIPGAYDLHYRRRLSQDLVPRNRDARIGSVIVESPLGGPQRLDIEVPLTRLDATVTIDGAAPPDSSYENGRIVVRDTQTGDEIELGQTREASFTVPLTPGQYEVIYRRMLGGDLVPVNTGAVLQTVDLGPGDQPVDIEIATAVLSGSITVGGATPPADPSDDGLLMLRDLDSGDVAVLGNTHDGSYSTRVIQGAYEVFYRQETGGGGVPANTNARLQALEVRDGSTVDIDIPMVNVSAQVTLNGELPPESVYEDGHLYLRDEQSGDSVLLGSTRASSLLRPVVPGTYDLIYVVEAAGASMPVNTESRIDTVDVGGGAPLQIDIPVLDLFGGLTLGGDEPPNSGVDRGALMLHDTATADIIPLGSTNVPQFRQTITAGTYVVAYRNLTTTGLVPANNNVGLACYELVAP